MFVKQQTIYSWLQFGVCPSKTRQLLAYIFTCIRRHAVQCTCCYRGNHARVEKVLSPSNTWVTCLWIHSFVETKYSLLAVKESFSFKKTNTQNTLSSRLFESNKMVSVSVSSTVDFVRQACRNQGWREYNLNTRSHYIQHLDWCKTPKILPHTVW